MLRGKVGSVMGEAVRRREQLILAWKFRGAGVGAQQINIMGARKPSTLQTWISQPWHC